MTFYRNRRWYKWFKNVQTESVVIDIKPDVPDPDKDPDPDIEPEPVEPDYPTKDSRNVLPVDFWSNPESAGNADFEKLYTWGFGDTIRVMNKAANDWFGVKPDLPKRKIVIKTGDEFLLSFWARGNVGSLQGIEVRSTSGGALPMPSVVLGVDDFTKHQLLFKSPASLSDVYIEFTSSPRVVGSWFEFNNVEFIKTK